MIEEPSPFAPDGAETPVRSLRTGRQPVGIPPHSVEAEQGILGCCIQDPDSIDASMAAGCTVEWFYDIRHQSIWAALGVMRASRVPIDMISLGQRLKDTDSLEGIGGLGYLSDLVGAVPSVANLPHYLTIASEKTMRRKLISASEIAIAAARDGNRQTEEVIAGAETAILAIRKGFEGDDSRTMKNLVANAVDSLQERIEKGDEGRVTTGFPVLDRICKGGWRPGNMIVIAARPSMGKTSMALSMARLISAAKIPVGFISLEMSEEEVTNSLCAQESGIDWEQFDNLNRPTEAQFRAMVAGGGRLKSLPIHICDGMRRGSMFKMTSHTIAAKARRWVAKQGVKIIFVDYLQRIHSNSRRDRQEQVSEISGAMKELARELSIPVVVLAQLNREFEKEKSRKPRLSDLRESGSIEQDADFVGMLYSPSEDDIEPDPTSPIQVNMFVAKNRKGARFVDVMFTFNRVITRFEEYRVKPA